MSCTSTSQKVRAGWPSTVPGWKRHPAAAPATASTRARLGSGSRSGRLTSATDPLEPSASTVTRKVARESGPDGMPAGRGSARGTQPGTASEAAAAGTFLVTVEADGSMGAVALAGRPDVGPETRRALVEAVAAAAAGCRFLPGTVDGQPARTFWLVEVQLTGPASPPAGPSP